MKRPYTGNTDGLAEGERKGLAVFIKELCALYPALWNNGSFVNRPKRGSSSMSVHATGRACDLSYRFMAKEKRGIKEGGRKQAMEAIDFVVKNADAFGLEAILDYFPMPHGRGWRCDRGGWSIYTKATIHGAPMGDWVHFEIAPLLADNPEAMREAFAQATKPVA